MSDNTCLSAGLRDAAETVLYRLVAIIVVQMQIGRHDVHLLLIGEENSAAVAVIVTGALFLSQHY